MWIKNITKKEKYEFQKNVYEFLSTLRVDHRADIRVGHEIASKKRHYDAKYFIKTKEQECDKGEFLKILELTKNTGKRSDEFLN